MYMCNMLVNGFQTGVYGRALDRNVSDYIYPTILSGCCLQVCKFREGKSTRCMVIGLWRPALNAYSFFGLYTIDDVAIPSVNFIVFVGLGKLLFS